MNAPSTSAGGFIRFLYTQNPFYLIGTFLILFGLQQSLGKEPQLASSGTLALLLAGYTVLLAGIAIVIVRWGRLWDDVRTILLVVALLFYMLSTSLDVQVLEQPEAGTMFLLAGLLFCLAVSETLLSQLGLQLPRAYRVAFYLSLAVLFLYPIGLAWISFYLWYELRSWAIGRFGLVASLPLAALLPAARSTTPPPVPCSATWKTPWYPWALFVFLTIGMGMRAWWLTISFDPTKGAGNCFQPYFLIPLVLVWAVLLVEAGLARRSRLALASGLILPWIAILLGYWGPGESAADVAFLARLTSALGTPPQLAVWSVIAFQGWAFLRTWNTPVQRWFEMGLTAAALLACVTGRQTLDWQSLATANQAGVALVAGGWLANAWRLQCSYRAILAAGLGGCCLALSGIGDQSDIATSFWRMHTPLLALLALLVLFRDRFAGWLRGYAVTAIPAMAVTTALVYPIWFGDVPRIHVSLYLGFLTLISIRLWMLEREVPHLTAAGTTASGNLLVLAWPAGEWLTTSWLAAGLPFLTAGLAIVVAGLAVSLLKMGMLARLRIWLSEMNQRLLPLPEETS
jgi:hypothetical protein